SGDSTDIHFLCSPPLNAFNGETIALRFTYDARQLGIINVFVPCAPVVFTDHPDSNYATLKFVSCAGFNGDSIATIRVVGLAADSMFATFEIQSDSSPSLIQALPCSRLIEVIPRCESPNVIYSSTQTSLFNVTPNPVASRSEE